MKKQTQTPAEFIQDQLGTKENAYLFEHLRKMEETNIRIAYMQGINDYLNKTTKESGQYYREFFCK